MRCWKVFCWLGLGLAWGVSPAQAQTTINGGTELLTQVQADRLGSWLGGGPITIQRVFAKGAGSTSTDFHAAVDGQGKTFSIIEADGPDGVRLIGGYNPQSWDSHGHYHETSEDAERTR